MVIYKMKTKKQISLNNSIRQLSTMREEYMSNKSLDLDSRINTVRYLEDVKVKRSIILSDNVEIENISNN